MIHGPHESYLQDPRPATCSARPASKEAFLFVSKSVPLNVCPVFLKVCASFLTSPVEATRNTCYKSSEHSFSTSGGCVGYQGSEGSSAVCAMAVQCIE